MSYVFGFCLLVFVVEHGTEDTIPKSRADAKSFLLLFVMMKMVSAPKWFHPFKGRFPGVNCKVHAGVQEIAKDKAGIKGKYEAGQWEQAEDEIHDYEKDRGDKDTGNGGQEQALGISWKMVVVFMEDEDKTLDMFVLRYEMINEPVHDIFEEGPEEHAGEEQGEDRSGGNSEVG